MGRITDEGRIHYIGVSGEVRAIRHYHFTGLSRMIVCDKAIVGVLEGAIAGSVLEEYTPGPRPNGVRGVEVDIQLSDLA
ncbi:MAG: hypothetical protein ABFD86_17810 [Bryobacteraceae bacterium]